jgi:hypothetical protein
VETSYTRKNLTSVLVNIYRGVYGVNRITLEVLVEKHHEMCCGEWAIVYDKGDGGFQIDGDTLAGMVWFAKMTLMESEQPLNAGVGLRKWIDQARLSVDTHQQKPD